MGLTVYPAFEAVRHIGDFTLTGDNFNTGDYPVTNLADTEFAKVARSTGTGLGSPDDAPVIRGTSSVPITVQAFVLAAHTMSLTGTWRIQLYSDAAWTNEIYDSELLRAWPPVYTTLNRSWYTKMFWTGQHDADAISGQVPQAIALLDDAYAIRSFEITLTDTAVFDIGYLAVAEIWQPTSGIETGAGFGYDHFTQTDVLPGGLQRHDVYEPGFRFDGTIPHLPNDEAQERALEMQRRYSVHTPFLFVMHPSRPRSWLYSAKLVTFAQPEPMRAAMADRDSFPLSLREFKG